jgi:hypothetical protein
MISIRWINETLQYYKEQAEKYKWNVSAEKKLLLDLCGTKDFIAIGKKLGNEKTQLIMQTIESNESNKYFKVTEKMKEAIISDLLSHFSFAHIIDKLCSQKSYYAFIYSTTTNEVIAKATRSSQQEAIHAAEEFALRISEPHACTTSVEGLIKPLYVEPI